MMTIGRPSVPAAVSSPKASRSMPISVSDQASHVDHLTAP
jgi:hypothetical protein